MPTRPSEFSFRLMSTKIAIILFSTLTACCIQSNAQLRSAPDSSRQIIKMKHSFEISATYEMLFNLGSTYIPFSESISVPNSGHSIGRSGMGGVRDFISHGGAFQFNYNHSVNEFHLVSGATFLYRSEGILMNRDSLVKYNLDTTLISIDSRTFLALINGSFQYSTVLYGTFEVGFRAPLYLNTSKHEHDNTGVRSYSFNMFPYGRSFIAFVSYIKYFEWNQFAIGPKIGFSIFIQESEKISIRPLLSFGISLTTQIKS